MGSLLRFSAVTLAGTGFAFAYIYAMDREMESVGTTKDTEVLEAKRRCRDVIRGRIESGQVRKDYLPAHIQTFPED